MSLQEFGDLAWLPASRLVPEHTVGLIPTGAFEQRGPHLPVRTDAAIGEALAERYVTVESYVSAFERMKLLASACSPHTGQAGVGRLLPPSA